MTDPVVPATRDVTCSNCNQALTISEPGPNDWDAITAPDTSVPGRQLKITGWRVIFACWNCGSRTAIVREVDAQ